MYEDDTPAAERRAQALSLDRDLLRELLGQEELRDLLDPGALAEVEASARGPTRATPTSSTTCFAVSATCATPSWTRRIAETLECASGARSASASRGEERSIAAEDAGLYRDAFGVMPPGGLPEAFLEPVAAALARVVLRFARSRGPFTTGEVAARYAHRAARGRGGARGARGAGPLVRGELRPGGSSASGATPTCCAASAAPRSRRCGARSSPPSRPRSAASCRPGTGSTAARRLREALVPLQGLALPVVLWEAEVLPRRVAGYSPASLDQLCASGEVVWVGAGLDRVALYYREDAPLLGPPAAGAAARGRGARRAPRGARAERRVLARPPRGDRARRRPTRCPRCGSSSGPAR